LLSGSCGFEAEIQFDGLWIDKKKIMGKVAEKYKNKKTIISDRLSFAAPPLGLEPRTL
jgi:hypothetical protein